MLEGKDRDVTHFNSLEFYAVWVLLYWVLY